MIKPWATIRDYFGELANLSDSFEAMANLVTVIERWSMEPMGFIDWRGFWNNYIGSLIYSARA